MTECKISFCLCKKKKINAWNAILTFAIILWKWLLNSLISCNTFQHVVCMVKGESPLLIWLFQACHLHTINLSVKCNKNIYIFNTLIYPNKTKSNGENIHFNNRYSICSMGFRSVEQAGQWTFGTLNNKNVDNIKMTTRLPGSVVVKTLTCHHCSEWLTE